VSRPLSNVLGVDDAPFERSHRGDVALVGAVCSRTRLDGLVIGCARRDGRNATCAIAELYRRSAFTGHVQAIVLQGIAVAGFNVIDIHELRERTGLPILVVARRLADFTAIRRALETRVPGGVRKWKLIERAGPMQPLEGVFVQTAGLELERAAGCLRATRLHGLLPEALRVAHLVAGALATGHSRGGA
jgi:uncharacterized protein